MSKNETAVIIHGSYGYPEENWFPWLEHQLTNRGWNVVVPQFPTPDGQEPSKWLGVLDGSVSESNANLIMIGHSTGCALILRRLERPRKPIRAAFLVSGFLGKTGNPEVDQLNAPFLHDPFDWQTISANCRQFFLYIGDDDPYVPINNARELAKNLDIRPVVIKHGGHINKAAGFIQFDILLQDIESLGSPRKSRLLGRLTRAP